MFILLLFCINLLALVNIIYPPLSVSAHECGSQFTALKTSQVLYSPSYPNDYSGKLNNCEFQIKVFNTSNIIVFKFLDFNLPESDNLEIFGKEARYYRFTSKFNDNHNDHDDDGVIVLPEEMAKVIIFAYGEKRRKRKFSLLFYATTPAEISDKYVATSFWGYITSPNFPKAYPLNFVKVLNIMAVIPTGIIMFELTDCLLENGRDFLKIYFGNDINPKNILLDGDCPNVLPFKFTAPTNSALIVFNSDFSNTFKGYNLSFAMYTGNTRVGEESNMQLLNKASLFNKNDHFIYFQFLFSSLSLLLLLL